MRSADGRSDAPEAFHSLFLVHQLVASQPQIRGFSGAFEAVGGAGGKGGRVWTGTMSIYGDAGGDELSGGLAAPAGSGPKAANPLASVAAAAGPAISGIQAKAAADPQKAKMVCAGLCVLFVVLIGWGYYDSETSAMGRCDDACPDVMFSAGLINGLNGTAKDACGGQHVHDAAVPAHAISLHGDTRVSEIGAHFDGGGECVCPNSDAHTASQRSRHHRKSARQPRLCHLSEPYATK